MADHTPEDGKPIIIGWDNRMMGLADQIALWSKEHGKRVGAVIVGPHNEIRSTGYNGLARKIEEKPERHVRETGMKWLWSVHAEVAAITNAARVGTAIDGCTIYTSVHPCADCAKAIIQSGITKVVTRAIPEDSNWAQSFAVSKEMLSEAGVKVEFYDISPDKNTKA